MSDRFPVLPPNKDAVAGIPWREAERALQNSGRDLKRIKYPTRTVMLLPEADVSHSATASIQVWPAANRALLTPFVITDSIVELVFLRFAVGSVGGNLDVGIYDKNFVRLVHSGAAAYGANANKIVALSTTLPEGRYFAAAASDGVAIKVFQLDGASAFGSYYMSGFTEADSSYPLPATLSPTPLVAGAAWLCGLQFQ